MEKFTIRLISLGMKLLLFWVTIDLVFESYVPSVSILGQNWRVFIFLYLPFLLGLETMISISFEVFLPKKKKVKWIYGELNDQVSRKNKDTGEVQFLLWKKGDQKHVDGIGHLENKWIAFDSSHWPFFEAY